ncbi:MAG: nucleoside triphosphate pyrophosphatase [Verrucomicrobiota bacterium]
MGLILASSSQRRQDLLENAHILFRVSAPHVDEYSGETHPQLSPAELTLANAKLKAEAVSICHPEDDILAADTIVYCDGRILGKPNDLNEAFQTLQFLSAKTHEVLTGVFFIQSLKKQIRQHVCRTQVKFRSLTSEMIRDYLDRVHVLDKAGSYAYQESGSLIVEQIEGSSSNIIGLPMETVLPWLEV